MAPRKHNDPDKKVDQSAIAWRGFQTAILGYIAAMITSLPLPGSSSSDSKLVSQRLTALETKFEIMDSRIKYFIEGFQRTQSDSRRK